MTIGQGDGSPTLEPEKEVTNTQSVANVSPVDDDSEIDSTTCVLCPAMDGVDYPEEFVHRMKATQVP